MCRPCELQGSSGFAVGADDLGGPRAHTVRPYEEEGELPRRAGEDTRPYEEGGALPPICRGRSQTGPRARTVRPYGGKRTGSVGSVWLGAAVELHQGQILQTQGLEARKEPHPSTPDFARRKGYITSKG